MTTTTHGGFTYTLARRIPALRPGVLVWIDGAGRIWVHDATIEAWWRMQEFHIMLALVAGTCQRSRQLGLFDMERAA
jgi:hypothetical protein